MTKNPILNDLIGLCIFIPVILLLHDNDPSDGLGLWSSLAFGVAGGVVQMAPQSSHADQIGRLDG